MSFADPEPQSALKSYAELLRLPNVFTAIADTLMGYLFVHEYAAFDDVGSAFWLLLGASVCLYLSGMVLNDVFDYDTDLAERPTRPLPSGRVPRGAATALGYGLWAVGLALGWAVSATTGDPRTGMLATALAALIWLYDRALKRTPLGPLAMGGCRLLNVLMAMSTDPRVREIGLWASDWCVAGGIGIYIAGVTWFARREAGIARRAELAAATLVMGVGLLALACAPSMATETETLVGRFNGAAQLGMRWWIFWALVGASIGYRALQAIQLPVAARVQAAVKHALVWLIVIDAGLTLAVQGSLPWPPIVMLLLLPTVVVGRWIYST